ncbi:ABC transporter permease [Paenibacillus gallinarum]|uniref:ABC transporter permease n=1 Tax=Paenibacillus gallinarum TaxID=2762232 RepID=A0ABR8T154_9BACL|nr:ABC transporter permease [Paenibacillus gallinarum]MBD7969471.1 ABC transporter permease [Paenibacillus gallinarum]
MLKLIKLELERNHVRTYVTPSIIIALSMLGILYLFAYLPQLEPDDKDMQLFIGYNNLIPLFAVLNMAAFCVLSAVMYSKFIIDDYSGKRPLLLFSYPVSRKKIFLSKLSVVSIFTILSLIISDVLIFTIFGVTERFIPLVNEPFTVAFMLLALKTTIVMAFISASIGIIAVAIGFNKKSVPTTIVSAVLLGSLMCNILVNATLNIGTLYLIALIVIIVGILSSINLMQKVHSMEVE